MKRILTAIVSLALAFSGLTTVAKADMVEANTLGKFENVEVIDELGSATEDDHLIKSDLNKDDLKSWLSSAEDILKNEVGYKDDYLTELQEKKAIGDHYNNYDTVILEGMEVDVTQDMIDDFLEENDSLLIPVLKKDLEKGLDRSKLRDLVNKSKEILAEKDKYESESIEYLEENLDIAIDVLNHDVIVHPDFGEVIITQEIIDSTCEGLEDLLETITLIPENNPELIDEFISDASKLFFDAIFNMNTEIDLFSDMMGAYEGEDVGSYHYLKESWEWFDLIKNDMIFYESKNSFNGNHAQGHFLKNPSGSNKTVFLAHGYRSNLYQDPERYFLSPKAKSFFDNGYNIFFLNAASHKALDELELSGKQITNFGIEDRHLYLDIINQYLAKDGLNDEIYLYGESMGAATVLMMSDLDLPSQVRGIIADSPFTDLGTLLLNIEDYFYMEGAGNLVINLIKEELGFIGSLLLSNLNIEESDTLVGVINKFIASANKGGLIGDMIKETLEDLGVDPSIFSAEGFKSEYVKEIFAGVMTEFENEIGSTPFEVSPLESIKNNEKIPIALIHNQGDQLIPYQMSEQIFAASPLSEDLKTIVLALGGNHCTSHSDDHVFHTEYVVNFIENQELVIDFQIDYFEIGFKNVISNKEFIDELTKQQPLPEGIMFKTNFAEVVDFNVEGIYDVELYATYRTTLKAAPAPIEVFKVKVEVLPQDFKEFDNQFEKIETKFVEKDYSDKTWVFITSELNRFREQRANKDLSQKEIDDLLIDMIELPNDIKLKVIEFKAEILKDIQKEHKKISAKKDLYKIEDWDMYMDLYETLTQLLADESSTEAQVIDQLLKLENHIDFLNRYEEVQNDVAEEGDKTSENDKPISDVSNDSSDKASPQTSVLGNYVLNYIILLTACLALIFVRKNEKIY